MTEEEQCEETIAEVINKKEAVEEYLEKHQILQALDQSINELFETRPVDVCGVLSQILMRRALPPTIDHLIGREVLDSRGNPTVEVDVYVKYLDEIIFAARSSAPSGASTGSNEAREVRDTSSPRYDGLGTQQAVQNVNEILSPALKDHELKNLVDLDRIICETDGTELKETVGGNACTAASFALAESGSVLSEMQLFQYLSEQFDIISNPQENQAKVDSNLNNDQNLNDTVRVFKQKRYRIPTPFFNILNGGKHAGGNLRIQEFMISPREDMPFPEQLRMASEVYHKLGSLLAKEKGPSSRNLGDEGGYAPQLNSPEEAITLIENAIQIAGYEPGHDIRIALDAAATEFYNQQTKTYEIEEGLNKTGPEMIDYWKEMIEKHPSIISIEDPLEEKDYENWIKLNEEIGDKVKLVGDDLYTTNVNTIAKGIEEKWCNALLLKVNQIGTISEAMRAAKLVLDAGQTVMVSHRSGETCNSLIADLAVAIGAQSIKTGSTARGERIQKYTRLLQIYDYLKENNLLIV